MKVALCFHGSTGYKQKLRGSDLEELEPLDISKPIQSIKDNLINHYETDVFIHSWSKERSDELIEKLSPKKFIFENHKKFSRKFTDRKNATCSKYYSVEKSNQLKKLYEKEKNFTYDVVMHTRFDILWHTKIPLDQDFADKYIFFPNWNRSINDNQLGPFLKENINVGSSAYDAWFFTSSEISDVYSKVYSNRRKLNKLCGKSWSPHKMSYLQARENNYELKNVLYTGYDFTLYRSFIQEGYRVE